MGINQIRLLLNACCTNCFQRLWFYAIAVAGSSGSPPRAVACHLHRHHGHHPGLHAVVPAVQRQGLWPGQSSQQGFTGIPKPDGRWSKFSLQIVMTDPPPPRYPPPYSPDWGGEPHFPLSSTNESDLLAANGRTANVSGLVTVCRINDSK